MRLGLAAAALASVGALALWVQAAGRPLFADADDPAAVARGATVYRQHCAACHGARLEGQKGWQTVGANGRLPAPPQDERGHSWMHSDRELIRIVKFSVDDPAAPGYRSDMPAFDGVLSDGEVLSALAFIKSRWPLPVRAYQAALNPGGRGMPQGLRGTSWKLPKDCGLEPVRFAQPRN